MQLGIFSGFSQHLPRAPELLAYQDLFFGQHHYNIFVRLQVALPIMIEVVMMVMRVVPMMAVMAVLVMMLLMVMPVIMTGTGSTGREQASEMKEN